MANDPKDTQNEDELGPDSTSDMEAEAANGESQSDQQSDEQASSEPNAEEQDSAAQDEPATLEDQVSDLEDQLAAAKDQALRAAAEMQNVRRRAEQDVEKAHKFGMEKLCSELLTVVDNLERAQQEAAGVDDEALKPVLEGIELTHKSFLDVLAKFNLEAVDPAGEPFDPQLHQAMTMVENPDCEPNTVMDVMQKGFTLHGRLLRPAMVVVSK